MLGLVRGFRFRSGQSLFGSGKFLFDMFVEPLFQLLLKTLWNVEKAESGESFHVDPGYLGLDFDLGFRARQRELQMRLSPSWHAPPQHQRDASFADVSAGRVQSFSVVHHPHQHYYGLAEVAAALL